MESALPFRHKEEYTILSRFHPLVRLGSPFILVIPFLIIGDLYLIITIILITLIVDLIARLNMIRIFSRIAKILPFVLLMTVFIPFYIPNGIYLSILLFFRIFGAIFVFLSFFSSLTYSEFVESLTELRLPSIFTGSFVIMLHYIPILADSNRKILSAQELRGKKITTYREKLKTHAFIMGKSIVMNMERSEKLYESMKMRGFSGKITFATRKVKIKDILLIITLFFVIISLIFFINLEAIYMGVIGLFLP